MILAVSLYSLVPIFYLELKDEPWLSEYSAAAAPSLVLEKLLEFNELTPVLLLLLLL